MFGYIYETTNLINGKKYIGKKESDRFISTYYGSGRHINEAINKYGINNFEIKVLEECNSLEELNNKEKYWINKLRNKYPINMIYNIANGGDGGDTLSNNDRLSEIKSKIGKAHKGRIIVNKNGKEYHIHKDELDKYIKDGFNLGRGDFIKSDKYREAQRNRNLGRKFSKETREKMSKSFRGRVYSEQARKNMSEAAKRREHTYWMNKDGIAIKVKEKDIDSYTLKGYKRGRGYSTNKK